ncbi:Uncharacterised protein [Klebsiella pneumoniae]|nr:Uncharacterised protein [Klebsiella pneumoniae]
MSNEDEFFAEMHPQIAQVIGIAVMQLLVEKREPSREALIEMIQVLWQDEQVDLAGRAGAFMCGCKGKSRDNKNPAQGRVLLLLVVIFSVRFLRGLRAKLLVYNYFISAIKSLFNGHLILLKLVTVVSV